MIGKTLRKWIGCTCDDEVRLHLVFDDGEGDYGDPGVEIPEHRAIMEQHLGHSLKPGETVHFARTNYPWADGKSDNRIENLELWVDGRNHGQRVSDQLEWARAYVAEHEGK